MEEVYQEFKKIRFNGGYTLGLMNPRHVLIRFDQEDDYQRCWIRTLWNIGGFSMRILKWKLGFCFEEDPPVVPIWVSLSDFPIEYMHPEVIFSMATTLGKPLKVDTPTLNMTRPSVAQFCVKVDLTKELPKSVKIGKKGQEKHPPRKKDDGKKHEEKHDDPVHKKKGLKIAQTKPKWLFKGSEGKSKSPNLQVEIVKDYPLIVKATEKQPSKQQSLPEAETLALPSVEPHPAEETLAAWNFESQPHTIELQPPVIEPWLLESSSGLSIKEKASIPVDIPDSSDSRTEQLEVEHPVCVEVVKMDKVAVTEIVSN
ncbi:OLC1v1001487C1 [Oldenlandia corymbosa var. corymbosa]|uniref:OLC1v1001487C1 n=1 Tax=Oldenlandia corymbosa var. corymbosa TaxID=529605 RepID=A0AAV1D7W8_OLDCO|nr:OLC1v1001487C1 [Oldenlandia corymbosa var. corymbosa]